MKQRNKNKLRVKIIAGFMSILILGLLVFAGPAQAFSINLDFDDTTVEQGKKIKLTATVDIDSGENLPIDEIVLTLDGPELVKCVFDITGKMKSGVNDACHGITIKKIPYPHINQGYGYQYGYNHGYGYNFGYGYGYTEQELVYEITIYTQKFDVGEYETRLDIIINGKVFSEDGENIVIEKEDSNGGSSRDRGCLTSWECEEWSPCIDGLQIRSCTRDKKYCYANIKDKPIEERQCSVTGNAGGNDEEAQTIILGEESEETNGTIFPGITGAVSAVTETLGDMGVVIIMMLLIAIVIVLIIIKMVHLKKRKSYFSYL